MSNLNPNIRDQIQAEALEEITKYRCSGLELSVGTGKTLVGLKYISKTQGKVLIVVPKLDIINTWINDAKKFELSDLIERCTFTTYLSLLKHDPSDYSTVILEEAHNTKQSHDPFLSKFKGNILGLTGTPPTWKTSEKGIMMSKYYPIRYTYKLDQSVDTGILNDYQINVYYLPLSKEKTIPIKDKQGKTRFKVSEQDQYNWITKEVDSCTSAKRKMFLSIQRINYLKQFTSKELMVEKILKTIPQDEKCLIFANTIEQAEKLCEHSHHSKQKTSDNLDKFMSGEITRLSAVEQLSEGINIPNLKHVIILHTYSGASPKAQQKVGRAMRLSSDQTSNIHILCYSNTIDVKWVTLNLEKYNKDKIKHIK